MIDFEAAIAAGSSPGEIDERLRSIVGLIRLQ